MKEVEKMMEAAAEKAGQLLNAEIEQLGGKVCFKKQRRLEIQTDSKCFICTLDLDLSFEHFQEDGFAFNQAEIFLLPEEVPAFTCVLSEHLIPFPTEYRQWTILNPNIASVCMEATEPPAHFAERLSVALQAFDQ
ncbi:hypothetical protein A1A1_18012 [Planococcus antarcticus DSM 14505]|uniref:Uncharacterized protein n=1 Tax=Planococcus antarcticus DSM 14505 TaxID=1185653 RepID=A0AA87LT27_9BACL|nr:hypothetical protein [Planococcus antarcticus]EIM05085.1 hypothetical protein A1A1_18012 [Planococcus antarcticus DSM 14505]